MRRILPVGRPPFMSYLFQLHPLSILARDDAYLPWLYSTHIQWFCHPGEVLKVMTHPLSTSHRIAAAYASTCPLLDVQSLELRAARQISEDALTRTWARWVAAGYYVQVDADYYYLSHSPEYRTRHFLHELLIHGVDGEQQRFTVLSYDARGRPVSARVPFQELERAQENLEPEIFREAARASGGEPPWFDAAMEGRPRVFLFRYATEHGCTLDLQSIMEQLGDYLNSYNTSTRHRLDGATRDEGLWGLAVYGWLQDQLGILEARQGAFDPLTWHVFWEHKACMLRRLQYLEEQDMLRPPGTAQAYRRIERMGRGLLWTVLRCAAAGGGAVDPARRTLAHLAEEESRLLHPVLQRLHSG